MVPLAMLSIQLCYNVSDPQVHPFHIRIHPVVVTFFGYGFNFGIFQAEKQNIVSKH